MNKMKSILYRLFAGRYGNDHLNTFIFTVALIIAIVNTLFFKRSIIGAILIWILLLINIYRSMSKKVYRRQVENMQFLQKIAPIRKKWNLAKKQAADKEHKYFSCPKCGQNVRVPKGRGKITITCPSCKVKFDRKS